MKSEKNHLEDFFKYFSLTPARKCHYTRMKLTGENYWWCEDSHSNCRDWLVLLKLLRTQYAPLLEEPQFSDLIDLVVECKEILADIVKMLERKATEVVEDPELEVDDKPGSEVVTKLAHCKKRFPPGLQKLKCS